MQRPISRTVPWIALFFIFGALLESCALFHPEDPERNEVIAGVIIPIPRGMNKSTEQRAELTLPGIGGGEVTYQGYVDPREIISYYQYEMLARDWSSRASLVTEGGALAYTKDNRSVLIRVGASGGVTTLDIIVGTLDLKRP